MKKTIPPKKGINADNVRLYRAVVDHCRKLEDFVLGCCSISELFSNQSHELRGRLKEQSETLLFRDPMEYGRKAEELMWRRNYHDFMQCYKRYKKVASPEEIALLVTHFISGIGHYDTILKKLSFEYVLDLSAVLPEIGNKYDYNEDGPKTASVGNSTHSPDETDYAKQCVHRIFVYIGDIFRYLSEIGYYNSHVLAMKWYNTAISYDPSIGMPFNQLGTLSGVNNYGLDAAYFYMRCLIAEKPFDGAVSNLTRILSSSSRMLEDIPSENTGESVIGIRKCIAHFLLVTKEFWTSAAPGNGNSNSLGSSIGSCLDYQKHALKMPAKISTAFKPTFLDSSVIYEMGLISLMLVWKLQDKGGGEESAAVAYALNFLYLLIEQCGEKVKTKFESKEEQKHHQPITSINNKATNLVNSSQSTSKENTPDLSPRRALSRLRRRKAAINFDDGESNLLDFDDDDSELSELEETALSTIDALDISSDISESGSVCDESDLNNHLNSSDEEQIVQNSQSSFGVTVTASDIEGVLQYIYYDTSLPTIKVFFDWLRINHKLMEFCVDSFKGLFRQLANLLNYLLEIEKTALTKYPTLNEFKYTDLSWEQKYPLTADFAVHKFKMLERHHTKFIDFRILRALNNLEMSFLCVECLLAFGHFVVSNINKSGLSFDAKYNKFSFEDVRNGIMNVCPLYDLNGDHTNEQELIHNGNGTNGNLLLNHAGESKTMDRMTNGGDNLDTMSPTEDPQKQKDVMRNMAHLWLKAEVSKLEKQVRGGKMHQLPCYLVVDSCAYLDYLGLIKDLVHSKRFIIIVPKIVLANLDQKKRGSSTAREAIRWLESEALKGTRFVKFLRETERQSLAPIKYPRRKDKDSYDFFLLLENCNYLNQQQTNGQYKDSKGGDMPMVTLLYSPNNNFPTNYDGVVRSAGISLEHIDVFVSKWRHSIKAKT